MPDIFLSYAREDAPRAEQVASGLARAGYEVFWDREIPPGTTWADYLEEKLSACKALVVLWSAASTQSQWVREEARMARDRGKLVPAMLDASAPPFGFGEVQAANLTTWRGETDHPDWARLIAGLQRLAGGQASVRPIQGATPPPHAPQQAASPPSPAPPAVAEVEKKKGPSIGLLAAGVGALIVIGAVLANLGQQGSGSIAPVAPQIAASDAANATAAPNAEAIIDPSVAAAAANARSAAKDAMDASARASANSAQGQQAAAAAQTGQPPFGMSQGPLGAVAGNMGALSAFQPAPVVVAMSEGVVFAGLLQVFDISGLTYSMDGVAALSSGPSASGQWRYSGARYDFIGETQFPGRFTAALRETGENAGATGVGVINYANGDRYEGEYRTQGALHAISVFRHGLGVLYGPDGAVKAQGRFANDALIGAN